MNQPETIVWKDPNKTMPDESLIVLVSMPANSEPVWLGYVEDGKWLTPEGMPIKHEVEHWAELPFGPN